MCIFTKIVMRNGNKVKTILQHLLATKTDLRAHTLYIGTHNVVLPMDKSRDVEVCILYLKLT